jgi:hypothetical protein
LNAARGAACLGTGLICTGADASQKTRSIGSLAARGAQGLTEGGVERDLLDGQEAMRPIDGGDVKHRHAMPTELLAESDRV